MQLMPRQIRFRTPRKLRQLVWLIFGLTCVIPAGVAAPTHEQLQSLSLPPGFTLEVLDVSVPNARQMALTDEGTLIVGTRREGKVYAVPNALEGGELKAITLFEDLFMPSGITVHDKTLFVAATNSILKVSNVDEHLQKNPPHTVLLDNLPDETHHGWKYTKVGPDNFLYAPVGAPCNICLSEDQRFASLLRIHPDTGKTEIWAEGIRNTVGFAWHPVTGELWFSDNGRDWLGDDTPVEEINIITQQGQHFGYPFLHGSDVVDPEFGEHPAGKDLDFVKPVVEIQAHSAALGMAFYTHSQFPESFQNALFVAEHGSWNRTNKVGYRVVVITQTEGERTYMPFIEGWLQGEEPWGRPNDVLVAPDGSLLISDDAQGRIYRVRFASQPD